MDSVLAQTDKDFEQVIMVDFKRAGIPAANRMFGKYAHCICGDYVYILDDDCVLIEPTFVARLKAFVEEMNSPTVVMVRSLRPQFKPNEMPHKSVWGQRDKIRVTTTNGLCYVVKGDVWREYAYHFGSRSAGDWRLLRSLLKYDFAWLDLVVGETQQLGRGRKFESVTGERWFDNIINGYSLKKIENCVYRMDPRIVERRKRVRHIEKPAERKRQKATEPQELVYILRDDKKPPQIEHSLLSRLNKGN